MTAAEMPALARDPKGWPDLVARKKEGQKEIMFQVHADPPVLNVGAVGIPQSLLKKMRGAIEHGKVRKFHGVEIPKEMDLGIIPRTGTPAAQFLQGLGVAELPILELPIEAGFLICEDAEGRLYSSDVIEGEVEKIYFAEAVEAAERLGYRVLGDFHTHGHGSLLLSSQDLRHNRANQYYLVAVGSMQGGRPYVRFYAPRVPTAWVDCVLSGGWVIQSALFPAPERLFVYTRESIILNQYETLGQVVPTLNSAILSAAEFSLTSYLDLDLCPYDRAVTPLFHPFLEVVELELSTGRQMPPLEDGANSDDITYLVLLLIYFNIRQLEGAVKAFELIEYFLSYLESNPARNRLVVGYFQHVFIRRELNYELTYPQRQDLPGPPQVIALLQKHKLAPPARIQSAEELIFPWIYKDGMCKVDLQSFGKSRDGTCIRCLNRIRGNLRTLEEYEEGEFDQYRASIMEAIKTGKCSQVSQIEAVFDWAAQVRTAIQTQRKAGEPLLCGAERAYVALKILPPQSQGLICQPLEESLALGHWTFPTRFLEALRHVIEKLAQERLTLPCWDIPKESLQTDLGQLRTELVKDPAHMAELPMAATLLFYRERLANQQLGAYQLTDIVKGAFNQLLDAHGLYQQILGENPTATRWLGIVRMHSSDGVLAPLLNDLEQAALYNAEVVVIGMLRDETPFALICVKRLGHSWERIIEEYPSRYIDYRASKVGGQLVQVMDPENGQPIEFWRWLWDGAEIRLSESMVRRYYAQVFHIAVVDLKSGQVVERW